MDNVFASDLFGSFAAKLNDSDISYLVLRNYESLPGFNESKDVDMLFSPGDVDAAFDCLKRSAVDLGYSLIWVNPLDYLLGAVFVRVGGDKTSSIKFDLFKGLKWRGCSYINHEYILKNAIEYKGFYIPRKSHEAMIMLVYYLLYAKHIRQKYIDPIYSNCLEDWEGFDDIVRLTFSEELSGLILTMVKEGRILETATLREKIRNGIVRKNMASLGFISGFTQHIYTEYYLRNTFGTLLVFSGPDGAGKSTLVHSLMELLCSLGINNNVSPHHLLSNKVPSLHRLPGAPQKYAKQDYTKPYQAETAGLVSSIIRTGYYFIAFFVDRAFFIKREMRGNQIVVFDRYYTDIMADPVRIRIGLPKRVLQKIFSFLPKPTHLFIILASKELIVSRKDELTEQKIDELLESYTDLSSITKKSTVMYNDSSVEAGQNLLLKNVIEVLENKFSKP